MKIIKASKIDKFELIIIGRYIKMDIIMQVGKHFSSVSISGHADTLSFSSVINSLSGLSDTIQNLLWFIIAIFTFIAPLFFIRGKTNKFTNKQIECLIKDGKYIPGIFVELNESKEVLRYFVHRKRWKKRLVQKFNFVYDNAYGEILRKAYKNTNVCYELGRRTSLEKIEKATKSAFNLHNNFDRFKVKFKPEYEESQVLFEISQYTYTDILRNVYQCSKAANMKYFILTGSAGNGKTNLLCSISELLMKLKQIIIFLSARDIEGDILSFLFCELKLPKIYKKHKNAYLFMVNLLLTIYHKYLFIIVDAINENDSDGFGSNIAEFINEVTKYSRINVIVSCRNEYYKERFRKDLVENVDIPAFEFDLKEQQYTLVAINRIIEAYSKHFNYSGNISPAVRNALSEQLLLLRIFFEVNKGSNVDVYSIRKHELYNQYIEVIRENSGNNIINVLNAVADFMIENEKYDEINLFDLVNAGITSNAIKEAVDSSVLLSKKLVFHEGTIARNEHEVIYFVFDEMRDYYLARRILLRNMSVDNVNSEAVLEKLKQLKALGASCAEGVIHYCYIFFRTDKEVAELGETDKICNSILDLYRIPEQREKKTYWYMHHSEELQNLGLRIILTSGIELADFEISYIQDCLRKDPYEDGRVLIDIMLDGTFYGGIYNLDMYLDILFGLKNEDEILSVFRNICVRNNRDEQFVPENFIRYYNKLAEPERKIQIQKVAELFLLFYELRDAAMQEELEEFFYNLPTHYNVRRKIVFKIREACRGEASDYE